MVPSLKFQYISGRKFWNKIVDDPPLEFSEPNLKYTRRNKKDKPNRNSVTKDKMTKGHY
jgi:hypothetical protein